MWVSSFVFRWFNFFLWSLSALSLLRGEECFYGRCESLIVSYTYVYHLHILPILFRSHLSSYYLRAPEPSCLLLRLHFGETGIVRYSGWMEGREPHFSRHGRQDAPYQTIGTNSCGVHVITIRVSLHTAKDINAHWQPTESPCRFAVALVNKTLHGQSTAGKIRQ